VAQAPKDGYTALLTFTAHVQNPPLFPNIGYDPVKDFTAVSEVAASSTILAVSPDFPARTLPELVKLVKAHPGKYPYGSYGMGTTGHILGELFKREAGLEMEHVPYKGGAPLATDLAAGHVKIGLIAVGTAKPLLQSGKLIPVAMAGAQRSALLPEVPTFLESGYKGFEPDAWMGLLMPAGVPAERAAALSKEVARIVRLPEIDKRMRELNLVPIGNTPQEFDAVLRGDLDKWSRFVRELNIKIE
jgi:tripartite-type tricarboxylate transporter receptor subunit TctC